MTARGLRIMVDMMSCTDRLKMLCVEPGTHPELWPTWHAWLVDYRELLVVTREVYEGHHG